MEMNREIAEKLKALAEKLNLQEERQYWIGHIKDRLDTAKGRFPSDSVIRQVSALIDVMAAKDGVQTIKESNLREYFNRYDRIAASSKWQEVMADMLPSLQKEAEESGMVSPYQRHEYSNEFRGDLDELRAKSEEVRSPITVSEPEVGIKTLPDSLKEITENLDEKVLATATPFAKSTVEAGKFIVKTELESMGFLSPQLSLKGFDENKLFYNATIDSNKGKFSFDVPIEVSLKGGKENVLFPTSFSVVDKTADLTRDNIQKEIDTTNISDTSKFVLNVDDQVVVTSELRQELYREALDRNFERCEEIIRVLQARLHQDEFVPVINKYKEMLKQTSLNGPQRRPAPAASRTAPVIATYDPRSKIVNRNEFDKSVLDTGCSISTSKIKLT